MRAAVPAILLCAITAMPVLAAPPEVETIVQQMKEVFEPARPSIRQVTFTVRGDQGETTKWVAAQALKTFPDGKRLLTVILAPEGVRGNAFLVQERRNKPSMLWVYSAFLRRVRLLVPVDVYQRFLDSDFTYADLSLVSLDGTYRLLGTEAHTGRQAYKVEQVFPLERAYYSRIITWVAVDSLLPLERHYYDMAGSLWKKEIFADMSVINGVPTPVHIRMEDVQAKTSTEFKLDRITYDAAIPDALFDPTQLPQSIGFAGWQMHAAQVVEGK